MFKKIQKKIIKLVEKIHFKLFGHEISGAMRKFLHNLSSITTGMIISSIFLFSVYILGARFLGPSEYGKFQIVQTIAQFMLIFMLFGLNTSVTKYLAEKKADKNKKIVIKNTSTVLFVVSILFFGTLFYFFRDHLSKLFDVDLELFNAAILFSIVVSGYYFARAILQGLQNMVFLAKIEALYAFVIISVFYFLATSGYNSFNAIFKAFVVGYLVFILLSFFKIDWEWKMKKIKFTVAIKIFKYAKFAILGNISGILLSNIDKLVLNHFSSKWEVGVYSAYLLASSMIFMQFINIFITVFFPQVSALENKNTVIEKINKISKLLFFATMVFSLFSLPGILWFVGPKYPINIWYILSFSFNVGLITLFQIKMWFLNATGIQGIKKTVTGTLLAGILNLLLNLSFIPFWGIYGAIFSTIIANILLLIYFDQQVNKYVNNYKS